MIKNEDIIVTVKETEGGYNFMGAIAFKTDITIPKEVIDLDDHRDMKMEQYKESVRQSIIDAIYSKEKGEMTYVKGNA